MAITRQAEKLRGRLSSLAEALRAPDALPDGWILAEYEVEQGISLFLARGDRLLRVELEARDEARGCYATTERFNVYYSTVGRGDLDADEIHVMSTVLDIVRVEERHLAAASPSAESSSQTLVREIEVERVLVREGAGGYYINPYVGCLIGCPYCYAIHRADFSRALDGAPKAAWGRWLDVKVNAPDVLEREVRELPPGVVRMSPIVTDPYQPVEKTYRITRRCLEILASAGFTPIVLSRSDLVLRDLEVLVRAPSAALGVSVPSDSNEVLAAFEPRTSRVEERVNTLRRARAAGIRTFAAIQPLLPMDPDRLVDLLAPHVEAVRLGPMHERQRSLQIYDELGRNDARDPAWEKATAERLSRGFSEAGVLVNPRGPEWVFL